MSNRSLVRECRSDLMHASWPSIVALAMLGGAGLVTRAEAAMAVIDVDAIAQLATQIDTLREQLAQAEASYQALTGGRGMENLLAGTPRDYLPPDWAALGAAVSDANTAYQGLAGLVNATLRANAVLTPEQVARLSPEERSELEAARRTAAMLQVTTDRALEQTSGRFDSLQQLINAIAVAQDPKAIMDLQARIGAEQAMLQNEQTKLVLLYHAAQAEEWARRQRSRERAIESIGSLRDLRPIGLND
jgi:hypothetical protein